MHSLPSPWRKGPRPDPTVIELIDQLLVAARKGQIRAIVVTIVNPLLEVESHVAGDMDNVKKHLLVGGISAAKQKILKSE